MSKLYYRLGKPAGFSSGVLKDKEKGFTVPVRELLQNANDASEEDGNECCHVQIFIEKIKKTDIPCIDEYESYLKMMVDYHKSCNSFNEVSQEMVNKIEAVLKKDEFEIFFFLDNGKGMTPELLTALSDDKSTKEKGGGSHGVGHTTAYWLSSLNYVLYASQYRQDNEIKKAFTGITQLAGFKDENKFGRGRDGALVKKIPEDERIADLEFLDEFPSFIEEKMQKIDNGTGVMVGIVGLNQDWSAEANEAIASNFFVAFMENKLAIDINHNKGEVEIPVSIEKSDIERLLVKRKHFTRKKTNQVLSGEATYQAWQTVNNFESKKIAKLSNGDEVVYYLDKDSEFPSSASLVRDGMLICRHDSMVTKEFDKLRNNSGYKQFCLVMVLKDDNCPELYNLVKNAESAYHNELEIGRLTDTREKRLKEIFKELSEQISGELEEVSRDGFVMELPFLEIQSTEAEQVGTNTKKPKSQTTNAKKKKENKKSKKKVNKGDGKKREAPEIASRSLSSNNNGKVTYAAERIEVALQFSPEESMNSRDEVFVTFNISSDSDNGESGAPLEIEKLTLDGLEMPPTVQYTVEGDVVKLDKTQINIGRLDETTSYLLKASLLKPQGMHFKFGVEPYFGLKQTK